MKIELNKDLSTFSMRTVIPTGETLIGGVPHTLVSYLAGSEWAAGCIPTTLLRDIVENDALRKSIAARRGATELSKDASGFDPEAKISFQS